MLKGPDFLSCVNLSPSCAKDGVGAQGWSLRCSTDKVGTEKGSMLWFTRIEYRFKKSMSVGSCALSQEECQTSSCNGSSFQTWQSLMWQRTGQAFLFHDPTSFLVRPQWDLANKPPVSWADPHLDSFYRKVLDYTLSLFSFCTATCIDTEKFKLL